MNQHIRNFSSKTTPRRFGYESVLSKLTFYDAIRLLGIINKIEANIPSLVGLEAQQKHHII